MNILIHGGGYMESFDVLKAREEEIAREWERLHDMINRVAQVRAENRNVQTFRILQEQCRIVGQRRVEAQMRLAQAQRG
jgi:hypothetical protein